MDNLGTGLVVSSIVLAVILMGYGLAVLIRRSKRPGKGFHAVGAMLMLFGWGNLRDPANNPVAEARDGRIRKGETSGARLAKDTFPSTPSRRRDISSLVVD